MKTALLVIDVQSYFMKNAPQELPSNIVHHIQSTQYDFVAFTIFRNEDNSNWEKSLNWYKCKSPEELQLASEFDDLADSNNTFEKTTYSALKQVSLLAALKKKGIEELYISGIDLDACVLATAYDAFDHGFGVKVLSDLCFSRYGVEEPLKDIFARNIEAKK